jgi:tripartite-type tricarboxylate transporter receptor subunit TctC
MRCCRKIASALALSLFLVAGASAKDFPNRPIRLIVPYSPGGGTDLTARLVAQKMSVTLGEPVVVENRGGASGAVGSLFVAKSNPDGYTILLGTTGSMAIDPSLRSDLPYNSLRDFQPISLISIAPLLVVANPTVPVNSMKEFITYAKDHPNQLTFSSSGGSSMLSGEMFKIMGGIQMVDVPYKGVGPAALAAVSGDVQITFSDLMVLLPFVRAGKLKALAVTSADRSPIVPEIPTVAESDLPGYQSSVWYGLFAPMGTPADVLGKLYNAVLQAVRDPDVRKFLLSQGATVVGNTPKEFAAFIESEQKRWAGVVQAGNLRIR